jgi:hypothetical protein
MANQGSAGKGPKQNQSSTTDQILDLLLDALLERQRARQAEGRGQALPTSASAESGTVPSVPPPRPEPPAAAQRRTQAKPPPARKPAPAKQPRVPKPGEEGWEPPPWQPSIDMGKMVGRLAILVVVLLILINIPVTRYGVSLARIMPETSSLIIRDGLVLKGSGPEIYMLENDQLRWISSLDAFEHMGLTWEDVHVVEDEFLAKFEKGAPIHVLLKCRTSPHIYRLENEEKRWIKDIDTFVDEGHVWEDVRFVGCQYLRDLPDGPPIPEDAGPPPQP